MPAKKASKRKPSLKKPAGKQKKARKPAKKPGVLSRSGQTGKPCTPFSVKVAILTPDDSHEIRFGLTKGCNPDNSVFWLIDFLLKEFKSGVAKTRVEVHVTIGAEKHGQAATLAQTRKLSPESVDLLNGPIADRASRLPAGTTSDKKLGGMLLSTI